MCGRFVITLPGDEMARLFEAVPDNDLPDYHTTGGDRFNVCPTQAIMAVTAGRRLRSMRWGFVPAWYKSPTDGPLIINARSETLAEKPAFRTAARQTRCLIPASGFYEWTAGPGGARLPYYITRADGGVMVMAGLWQDWQGTPTCAIVSTEAGPGMAGIHDREPVMVEPADWPLWLGEAGKGAATLMRASAPGVLAMHRVGVAVNSNRASGPGLVAEVAA